MSMGAALKAERPLQLARRVIAIDILYACQAIDPLAPLASSDALMAVHAQVRAAMSTLTDEGPPAPDIEAITEWIAAGAPEYAGAVVVN